MLARQRATMLPDMTLAKTIETTRMHRVARVTGCQAAWVTTRPCRAPQHTISDVGLIGRGQMPMPGEFLQGNRRSDLIVDGFRPPLPRICDTRPRCQATDGVPRVS
jgi:predicted ATPase with chaperone activity